MKTVMVFNADDLKVMLTKSNVWYLRHYEEYFDRVYAIYLLGEPHEPATSGRTTLISVSSGRPKLDFLLAPYRIYKLAKELDPTNYITLDIIWSWWLSILLRLFMRARIYLNPQFQPDEVYRTSKRSVSGMPIWLERVSIWLSFLSAYRILTGNCFGNYKHWLGAHRVAGRKLIVVDTLVEALPPPAFFEKVRALSESAASHEHVKTSFESICVGRLHPEKLIDGLVKMMQSIKEMNNGPVPITLTLIGDGPQRAKLEQLACELGVSDVVRFMGQVRNENLPEHLARASVYVSPYTGMSLREAALFGLPIISYEVDWLRGVLKHGETVLLAPVGDYEEMARQVIRLAHDRDLYERLSLNIKEYAWRIWSPLKLRDSLRQAFENKPKH